MNAAKVVSRLERRYSRYCGLWAERGGGAVDDGSREGAVRRCQRVLASRALVGNSIRG